MPEREYTLVEIIRDPRMQVYEASELTRDGHYYLYHYDAMEGLFYRATVPSGAAAPYFHLLKARERVPVGGWQVVEGRKVPRNLPHLVKTIEGDQE